MNAFPYFFPVFFVGGFILVLYVLSKKGWLDLAAVYQTGDDFQGERVGIISASINGVNYNNCLLLKFNHEGLYLKPIFVFRLFHPPLFIPWKDIADVRDKKILFSQFKELVIGSPAIAFLQISKATFLRLERPLSEKSF